MAGPPGSGHSRAGLIHELRKGSLVKTEESGGANLAAFVPLTLLMMHIAVRALHWKHRHVKLSKLGRRRRSDEDTLSFNGTVSFFTLMYLKLLDFRKPVRRCQVRFLL